MLHTYNRTFSGQYYFAWNNYSEAIKCLAAIPKYRIQATEIAKSEGEQFFLLRTLFRNSKSGRLKRDKKAERGMSREEVKEAEEQVSHPFNTFAVRKGGTTKHFVPLKGDPRNNCGQDGYQGRLCQAPLDRCALGSASHTSTHRVQVTALVFHAMTWIINVKILGGPNSISFGCGALVFWGQNMGEMSSCM